MVKFLVANTENIIHVVSYDTTNDCLNHEVDFSEIAYVRDSVAFPLVQVGQSAPETQHDSQSLPRMFNDTHSSNDRLL